ncbi:MAG: hypothetical protein ACM3KM_00855 [Acidobacteriaceae bacterium]
MALNFSLRKIYLYVFAALGLILMIISGVQLVDLGLKAWVFKNADTYSSCAYISAKVPGDTNALSAGEQAQQQAQCEQQDRISRQSNRERQASTAVAMMIVGIPVFLFHWKKIQKENRIEGTVS